MFSRVQLNDIFARADTISIVFPVSYQHLMGHERLAVLPGLKEPIQSTLHAIIQQNVPQGTSCIMKGCNGTLDKTGLCSRDCSQFGVNAVDDIIRCWNCDSYGFPCSTCHENIFHGGVKMYLDMRLD